MTFDVSVIIPVYNASVSINRCINSILLQKTQFKIEVIFVNDGSTDDSSDIIKSYNNPDFILIEQENGGPAKARNAGLHIAQGKYVSFLDADDYWDPIFIQTTVEYLIDHDEVVAVNTGQNHIKGNRSSIVPICVNDFSTPLIINDFFSFWNKYHHVCTGSVVLKKDIAMMIGGQREDLRAGEDWEFWMMVATYGKWAFIPKVLFVSNGDDVTKVLGWVEKMKPRWETTPPIYDWEKRLVERFPLQLPLNYKKARGYVGYHMIHAHILGKRLKLARKETLQYKDDFPPNTRLCRLFKACSKTSLSWWIMSKLLLWREYHRY